MSGGIYKIMTVKRYHETDVFTECKERISYTFDNFDRIYVSFSGGKDSTVMLHMVMDEAKKRNRQVGVMIIDLEGQYEYTINHIQNCVNMYRDMIDLHWICLPIHLRNAVSVYEPHWVCWDKKVEKAWIRQPPKDGITDESFYPFFHHGMEFEEFDVEFGKWYSQGKSCACFIGIRSDESLNRFRTIASKHKKRFNNKCWTTEITPELINIYPIYDWKTRDVWIYQSKNRNKPHNELYDVMNQAGLTISQMRICQPYGDDQRRGLWLFHLIEPHTWARVVARVNGANSGSMYINETGNINGYRKISKPEGHTWKSFAELLLNSLPEKSKEHFSNKIYLYEKWWLKRGYEDGLPDEADLSLESARKVPSWRRICKTLLRNDYWSKGLGFSQHKSEGYLKYLELMKKRKALGVAALNEVKNK